MKPYGIKHVGPCCEWGCCFVQNRQTSPGSRKVGHGPFKCYKTRARRAGKKILREWA